MNTSKNKFNTFKNRPESGQKRSLDSWNNRHYPINNPIFRQSQQNKIQINAKETQLPKINNNQTNLIQSRDLKDEAINEELGLIQNIWEDLGVSDEYQNQFLRYIKTLNDDEKKEFFEFEKKNLKRFRDCLLKLSKEVSNREKNIEDLKKFDKIVESTYPDENQKLNDSILSDIINCIKSLRVNSVNTVNHLNKIREISTYNSQKGKYNLDKINPAYLYNKNYLVKMNNDMNFLNNSTLSKYIDMSNGEPDAFLTNCAPKNNDNQRRNQNKNKITIPIGEDLMKAIKSAKYSIIEDVMFNNMQSGNNKFTLMINSNDSRQSLFKSKVNTSSQIRGLSAKNRSVNQSKFSINNNQSSFLKVDNSIGHLKSKQGNFNSNYSNNQNDNLSYSAQKNKIKIERDDYPNMTRDEFLQRLDELGKQKEEQKNEFEEDENEDHSMSDYIQQKQNEIEENKNKLKNKKKEEIEKRKKKEGEEKRKKKEEEEKKRRKEEEERKKKEEEEKKKKKEEEKRKKKEEEERKRKEEEEERKRKEEEEERKRKEEEENDDIIEENFDFQENKEKEEEEERLRKEKEEKEEEERLRKEKEEKEEEERLKKEKEEEEERLRKEKEEEEERLRKEKEEKEEEERLRKEKEKEEEEERLRKEKEEEEERLKKEKEEEEERLKKEKEEEEERLRKEKEEQEQEERLRKEKEEEDEDARQKQIVIDAIEEEKKRKNKQLLKPNNSSLISSEERAKNMVNQIFDKFNNEEVKDEEEDLKMSNKIMIQKETELIKKLENTPEDFNIEFYTGYLKDLIEQLNNIEYLNNIHRREIDTFDISQITEDIFLKGFEPKILISYPKEKGKNSITGLCKFSYENEFGRSKIVINHISTINRDGYENDWLIQIELLIKYIINNLVFNELLLVLTYSKNENDEQVIDEDIKELFEQKLEFKWSFIENLEHEKRKQTLQYMKEEEPLINIDKFISIDSLSIITLTEYQHYREVNLEEFINIFTIYALLSEKNANKEINIEKKNKNSILFEDKLNYLKNIINFYLNINDKNQINEFLKDKVDLNLDSIVYNNDTCDLVTMKLNPELRSRITIEYNNYYYNRIETEIGILTEPNSNGKFYFIPTNDQSISIMICELNSELKNEFLYKNNNIYEYFYTFYSKFVEDSEKKNVIYIPSFNLEGNLSSYGFSIIEKNINIYDNNNKPILFDTVDEVFKVKMNNDPNFGTNFITYPNTDGHNNGDIIINDSFLFGICNVNILTNFNIPVIQLFIITKDYWIKV